jgi:hypothetical protein
MSHEAMEAAERNERRRQHEDRAHGAYAPGHVNYIPPELLCKLAVEREGSRYHKVLNAPGPGGAGSAPLNDGEFACALATSVDFRRMVADDEEIV